MKALLLAATSSLALTGFAMAQTATTTETNTTVTNPAAAAGDKVEDAADATESALDKAGNRVDEAVTTSAADAAEDAADRAEDAADAAEGRMDAATTAGTATTTTTTQTDAVAAPVGTTAVAPAGTTAVTPVEGATATTAVATTAVVPDVNAPVLSAENPGMLGSWIMNRRIWTTNQPSSTAWNTNTLTERPADWANIAKVDDIVVDGQGNVTGYIADIGGFLGLGAKRVLLGTDALHFTRIGDDAFFATNFTKEELQALPEFDSTVVMK